GEDVHVVLAPPLAVGDDVEPGPLLHPHGSRDRRVEERRCGLGCEPAGLPVEDDVANPARPGQTADDVRGERHRAGSRTCRSRSARTSRSTGRAPEGQSITSLVSTASAPSPKWTMRSLPDAALVEPQKTSRTIGGPAAGVATSRAPQPSRLLAVPT